MLLGHIFGSIMALLRSPTTRIVIELDDLEPEPLNFQGVPTAACPVCGGEWFNVPVSFDKETYEIDAWGLDAECYSCGTLVTVVCPVDAEERDLI
jgi:hypothetical protein